MPERSYAHLKTRRSSWHVLARVTDSGWFARCGLALGNDYRAAMTLPAGSNLIASTVCPVIFGLVKGFCAVVLDT